MPKNLKRTLAAAAVLSSVTATATLALTQAQEAADCQDDALRLCGPYIPDHAKIRACLVTYQAYLSHACRAIVAPKGKTRH